MTHHDWYVNARASSWFDAMIRVTNLTHFVHDLQPGVTPAPAPGVPASFAPPNQGPSWRQGQKPIITRATLNGRTIVKVRIHGIDSTAPPGSNSSQGWVVRIIIGKKNMDGNGVLHPPGIGRPNSPHFNPELINDVHIPIEKPQNFPGVD